MFQRRLSLFVVLPLVLTACSNVDQQSVDVLSLGREVPVALVQAVALNVRTIDGGTAWYGLSSHWSGQLGVYYL